MGVTKNIKMTKKYEFRTLSARDRFMEWCTKAAPLFESGSKSGSSLYSDISQEYSRRHGAHYYKKIEHLKKQLQKSKKGDLRLNRHKNNFQYHLDKPIETKRIMMKNIMLKLKNLKVHIC